MSIASCFFNKFTYLRSASQQRPKNCAGVLAAVALVLAVGVAADKAKATPGLAMPMPLAKGDGANDAAPLPLQRVQRAPDGPFGDNPELDLFGGPNGGPDRRKGNEDERRRGPLFTIPPEGDKPRHFSNPNESLDLTPDGQLKRAPDLADADKLKRDKAARRAAAEEQRKLRRALLRRRPGLKVPDHPTERDRLLQVLYGHLAKAKSKTVATRIKAAIEHVWGTSGSDTASLLMARAVAAGKRKNYGKALTFLNRLVKIAPDYVEGWNQRAYVYFKQEDYQRALGDLRRVLALDPNHFKALQGLGRMLREIDEKRAALRVYRRLLKVYPLSNEAKQALRQLTSELGGKEI